MGQSSNKASAQIQKHMVVLSHNPEADNQKAKLSNPEAITMLKECYVRHPDQNNCHSQAVGVKNMELDYFEPRCIVIIEFSADRRILLGGPGAADSERHLTFHGVRAKCCLAGRESRHRIHHSPHLQSVLINLSMSSSLGCKTNNRFPHYHFITLKAFGARMYPP